MTSFYSAYSSIGSLLFFTFVFGIPCGLLCSSLANNKGYNVWKWFACGVLFNFLGLIAAAGLPDRLLRNQLHEVLENKSWASKSNWYQNWLFRFKKIIHSLIISSLETRREDWNFFLTHTKTHDRLLQFLYSSIFFERYLLYLGQFL